MSWIQIWIGWELSGIFFLAFYMRMLERRYSVRKTVFLYYGAQNLAGVIKMWFMAWSGVNFWPPLSLILVAINLYILLISFNDSRSKKLVVGVMGLITMCVGESLTWYLCIGIWHINLNQMFEWRLFLLTHVFVLLLLKLMEIGWRKQGIRREATYDWCFIMILFGICVSFLPNFYKMTETGVRASAVSIWGTCIGLLFVAILPVIMLETEKTKQAEARLKQQRRRYQLEEAHCWLLIGKQNEIAKFRHDFNNQLMVVYSFIGKNKIGEAEELLGCLEGQMDEFGSGGWKKE